MFKFCLYILKSVCLLKSYININADLYPFSTILFASVKCVPTTFLLANFVDTSDITVCTQKI